MKKLPKLLYHYTAESRMGFILDDGFLMLTPSNLKMDDDTLHKEPMYHKGEKTKVIQLVDKYKDYHPVVWLTSNDDTVANETGLSADKTEIRLTVPTKGKEYKYMKWTDFLKKYNANPVYSMALKRGEGADWKNWYICESAIPLSEVSEIIDMRTGKEYEDT